ncbi:uncharacterized protein [Drosophila takahashii]|uniref:uncharacterized protein n=1 Tax=Drosophila takahashii TaxID=29030 RepID=UPI0038992A96
MIDHLNTFGKAVPEFSPSASDHTALPQRRRDFTALLHHQRDHSALPQRRRDFLALLQRQHDNSALPQRHRDFTAHSQRRSSQQAVKFLATSLTSSSRLKQPASWSFRSARSVPRSTPSKQTVHQSALPWRRPNDGKQFITRPFRSVESQRQTAHHSALP